MSNFQFIASNGKLPELDNPYIEMLSINDALAKNMAIGKDFLKDKTIDRDEKIFLICDSEEHLSELTISKTLYYDRAYAEFYSSKKRFAQIDWKYTDKRAVQLIGYIKNQIWETDQLELWDIWVDEYQEAKVKEVVLSKLSISDLSHLDAMDGFEGPSCLIVKHG